MQTRRRMGFNRSSIGHGSFLPLLEIQDLKSDVYLEHVWLLRILAELKRLDHERVAEGLEFVNQGEDGGWLTGAVELNGGQFARSGTAGRFADGAELYPALARGVLNGGGRLRHERFF